MSPHQRVATRGIGDLEQLGDVHAQGTRSRPSITVTTLPPTTISLTLPTVIPTRNLMKLGRAKTVAEAIANARADRIITVEPKVIDKDGKQVLTIPPDAGYGHVEEPLSSIRG